MSTLIILRTISVLIGHHYVVFHGFMRHVIIEFQSKRDQLQLNFVLKKY
jgi:hypothetical protein